MPCLSNTFNPAVGPLIQVVVVPPEAITGGADETKVHACMALIDTGASHTCLSKNVVDALDLQPVGKRDVMGVHGAESINQYHFGTGFVLQANQDATGAVRSNIQITPCQGTEFVNENCGFEVLLGRDVICTGHLSMSYNGQLLFAF